MAILKHISSKSANYCRIMEYLMFEQDRLHNQSLRNENGNLVMRENYLIDSLECNVATFDIECEELNNRFHKNHSYNDIKSHHYIISFDPKDSAEGLLTLEDAQRIGMDYARRNFPGHQAIVCTHDDGENHSRNIHVHIVFNSLRKSNIKKQPYMTQRSDYLGGFKHHLTNKYLEYLKQDLMYICQKEKLHQVDLLSPAKKHVTEKEYWANTRGKRAHGSDFILRKDKLRKAIKECSKNAKNEKEFARLLKSRHNITLKISRGRYGYIISDRQKPIRGRMLGTDYTEEALRPLFVANSQSRETLDNQNELNEILKKNYKYPKAFTMDTKVRLVKDLQTSAIATTNRAIERKIKITNLKNMAKTIMFIEEHGYEDRYALNTAYDKARATLNTTRSALKRSEDGIKALNEQIHYTGQYLANKGTYQAYMKAKNKAKFRLEHEDKIILYEAARKYLKEHTNAGTLPSLAYIKSAPGKFVSLDRLKDKRSELIEKQKALRKAYNSAKNAEKELALVKKNVDTILKEPELYNEHKKHKNKNMDK